MNVLHALTEKKYRGMALLHFENEKPLQGLLGEVDWKLAGVFTRLVREGTLTGKKNEMSYVPVKWNEETFHFLIVGNGQTDPSTKRPTLTADQLELVQTKITQLQLADILIEGMSEWN